MRPRPWKARLCSQPRKLAAWGLGEHVAKEYGGDLRREVATEAERVGQQDPLRSGLRACVPGGALSAGPRLVLGTLQHPLWAADDPRRSSVGRRGTKRHFSRRSNCGEAEVVPEGASYRSLTCQC